MPEFTKEQRAWIDDIVPMFVGVYHEVQTGGLVIKKELDRYALQVDTIQWMTTHDIDLLDHQIIQKQLGRNIILTGLGLGVGIIMADMNPTVQTVTVVENDARVIDVVLPMVLPKLNRVHVQLIETDANTLNTNQQYDFAFLDHAEGTVPDETVAMYQQFCTDVATWAGIRQELEGRTWQ